MIKIINFFILICITSCSSHRIISINENQGKQTTKSEITKETFRQRKISKGKLLPKECKYKKLHFTIDYGNKNEFLRISNQNKNETFSLHEEFAGIGINMFIFDNKKVQFLVMELEYEYVISTHFYLIQPNNIRECAVVDFEIESDNFNGLKYKISNRLHGVTIQLNNSNNEKNLEIEY